MITRKVKASEKAKQALKKRMVPIITSIIVVAVLVGVVGSLAVFKPSLFTQDTVSKEVAAVRALRELQTDYEGMWIVGDDNLFQIYMPGDKEDEDERYLSQHVVCERNTDYDNSMREAYGIAVSEEQYSDTFSISDDIYSVANTMMNTVTNDIGVATLGKQPGGSFEISEVTLGSGLPAVKVTGEIETTQLLLKNKDSEETYTEERVYPVRVYITLINNHLIAVWGTWDSSDYFVNEDAETKIFDFASTLFADKYTGTIETEKPVDVTIPTDTGEIATTDTPVEENVIDYEVSSSDSEKDSDETVLVE